MANGEREIRGVTGAERQAAKKHFRDYRKLHRRLHDLLATPRGLGIALILLAIAMVVFSAALYVLMLATALLAAIYAPKARKTHLPARLPVESGQTDYNDPLPTRKKMSKARGAFFAGNSTDSDTVDEEIHFSVADMLTHFLLFGTTGSGKTEALLSLGWNSLTMGSGMSFVDPKGTNKLPLQIWSMARMLGRDDDFLLTNYSTGNRTIKPYTAERLSNTSNPFSHGTADFLSDILNSLIPTAEGENAIFSERALALMKTLMIGLVEMRDQGRINLSVRTIREWMTIDSCMQIMDDESLSDLARASMRAYLNSVAGFNAHKAAGEQGEDAYKQFGFAQAYFTRALSSLTDTYGHVYGSLMGEVDDKDVMFNRRIRAVVLPSMEKAPPELMGLAKVVLASIRSALATGLGSRFEGDYESMIESLPAASNVPNLNIFDEYGYIALEGFAVVAAQARQLGAATIFAGQDYAGLKRGSETEAEQLLANTKIKAVMAMEDVQATWEVIQKLGGEVPVTVTSGYQIRDDDPIGSYQDSRQANVEKRNRVDLLDLRDQIEGEFHMFHKGNLIRGQMFHADPDIKSSTMYIHRMVEIDRPTREELSRRYGPIRDLSKAFTAKIDELVAHGRAAALIADPVLPRAGEDRLGEAVVPLLRRPDMERYISRREQAFAAVMLAFGGVEDTEGLLGESVALSQADTQAKRWARETLPEPENEDDGSQIGIPLTSGEGLSLADTETESDEDFELDDEASEHDTPLPPGQVPPTLEQVAAAERESQGASGTSSRPGQQGDAHKPDLPLRPAHSVVQRQLGEISAIAAHFGGEAQSVADTLERRLENAAEYPQPPTPQPDRQQQRRVLSSLQEIRQRGRKYRNNTTDAPMDK